MLDSCELISRGWMANFAAEQQKKKEREEECEMIMKRLWMQ